VSGDASASNVPRVTLAELLLPAGGTVSCAADAAVDYYDITSFRLGAPSKMERGRVAVNARVVASGDVLLSRRLDVPRRAWVVEADRSRPQLASSDWLVVRNERFDPVYLRHLLVSNDFHLSFERAAASRGRQRAVTGSDLAGILVPLPCREVQQSIGRALQHADALRAKRQAVAARLACLPEAAAAELRIIARDAGWPQVRLGDLLAVPPQGADGAPMAHPGAERRLAHEELQKLRFDTARVDPDYVYAMIAGEPAIAPAPERRTSARQRRAGVARRLEDVVITFPPREEQARLVALVAAARALDAKLQASTRALDALLGTLRDKAFRGELRVGIRGQAPVYSLGV
jgi:hypothetical protein